MNTVREPQDVSDLKDALRSALSMLESLHECHGWDELDMTLEDIQALAESVGVTTSDNVDGLSVTPTDDGPTEYLVRWEIDIHGDSPREAAQKAWDIQVDPQTLPPAFTVVDRRTGSTCEIDLEEDDSQPSPRIADGMGI